MTADRGRAIAVAVVAGLFLPLAAMAALFTPMAFDSPGARGVWQTDLFVGVILAGPLLLLVALGSALVCAASPSRARMRVAVTALALPFLAGAVATLVLQVDCGGSFACPARSGARAR